MRSAGEDAWLGRPAPHNPVLDGPLTEETALPSDDLDAAQHKTNNSSSKTKNPLPLPLPSSTSQSSSNNLVGGKNPKEKTPPPRTTGPGAMTLSSLSPTHSKQPTLSGDALVAWSYGGTSTALARQRTSFRCIKEAVKAARDGDRILLQPGVHNGMG